MNQFWHFFVIVAQVECSINRDSLAVSQGRILEFDSLQDYLFHSGFRSSNIKRGNVYEQTNWSSFFVFVQIYLGRPFSTDSILELNIFVFLTPPVLSTCPLYTNSGCGKERRILIGPW